MMTSKKNVERKLKQGLSVADLIAELESMPQDAQVVFACDYGDHCHTQQALPVERCEEMNGGEALVESAYSKSGLAIEDLDDDDYGSEGDDRLPVVVLR